MFAIGAVFGLVIPQAIGEESNINPAKISEEKVPHWKVYQVHPWIEADAQTLPARLTEPLDEITLSGPRNDWLTGAAAIAADADSIVTVSLEEPEALRGRIQLRVVGQVRERHNKRIVWDPLISKEDLPDYAKKAYNYQQIKDFPKLNITPKVPAFLWLTVDLRNIRSGQYTGALQFKDPDSNTVRIPLNINVTNAELPIESPLFGIAWNWLKGPEMARDFAEHGINVAFRNHEDAWKSGASYLLVQFHSSFHRDPIDEAKKQEVKKELDEVWAMIDRLKVPRDHWGLYLSDETNDKDAETDAAYAKLVKKLRPDTPIWNNPSWGQKADSHQNWTTVEGTLKKVAPYTDVWCPYSWHLWDNTGALEYMKSTRKPTWFYEIWETAASRRPAVGKEVLRKGPWIAWKYRLQGFGVFSANDTSNDCWDDLDPDVKGYPNYSFTYPGANGVMSSRGYEAIRQGVQEYKRLYTLKKLGANPAVLDAWMELALDPKGVETYDSIREQMDKLLVKLSSKK